MTSTLLDSPGSRAQPLDPPALGPMLTAAIHNGRNIVMAARGYAELIQRRPDESLRHREWADKMIRQLDRLIELYARMGELAPSPSNWVRCPLEAVVARAERSARLRLREPARSVVLYRDTALSADVTGDLEDIARAVSAVLENAFEATPPGGTVRAALEVHGPGRFQLTFDDEGSGLGPDAHERAGRPFYTTKPERLGLGLYLANAALGRYGLRLLLSNRPEGGARATITQDRAEGGLQ